MMTQERRMDDHTKTHMLTDEVEVRSNVTRTLNVTESSQVSRLVGTLMDDAADSGLLCESFIVN